MKASHFEGGIAHGATVSHWCAMAVEPEKGNLPGELSQGIIKPVCGGIAALASPGLDLSPRC